MFTPDTRNKSKCNVVCQYAWPPLKTSGRPRAGTGVHQGELGQTAQHQATYYGHPLYYYGGDSKPGQASGEDIHSFGGSWYLVSANGRAVK
jgi:predicted lipoprotein with Yx(FWY)xxD motif